MVHNDHVRAISFGTSFLCGGFHSVRDNTMDNSRPEILSSEALPIFLKLLLFLPYQLHLIMGRRRLLLVLVIQEPEGSVLTKACLY